MSINAAVNVFIGLIESSLLHRIIRAGRFQLVMYTKCELEWALDHFGHHVKGHLKERVIKAKHIIDTEPGRGKEFHAIIREAYKDLKEHGKLTPKSMLHPPRLLRIP